MVTSLHELTKQLDALTYNSRSVLNALIRSVLSAGSSDGYQVIRAGKPITLSRTDIYHLYTLYQIWESRLNVVTDSEGVTSYGLAELVAELDADYQSKNGDNTKTPYTEAVVKHSQILYKNSDNADNEDAAYWISLVDQSSNPKMVTNSAPIPVNIRTPIYDENLSTKRFSEYETYLFPRGYYTLDAMGSYGDGMVHNAGGHKWLFDVDSVFQVKSPLSLFGVQDNEWSSKLPDDYGKAKDYSLVVGTNNFSYNANNFISGRWNQSIGRECAIMGGSTNHTYAGNDAVLGGTGCAVVDDNSTAGGAASALTGSYSLAYGYMANVGGHAYPCSMCVNINDGKADEPTTECQATIPVDGCTYIRVTSPSNSSSTSDTRSLGSSELYITNQDVEYSGLRNSYVSSGDSTKTSPLDFKVGDMVRIFDMHMSGKMNEFPISEAITAKVTGITPYMSSNGATVYGYIVTLDRNIIPSHNLSVNAGYVMRYNAIDVVTTGNNGKKNGNTNIGTDFSAALGIRTIAAGNGQVVVGAQNRELLRPNFIVGIGNTDYVAPASRFNGLVVGPYSNYSTIRGQYIVSGISNFTTASLQNHGMFDDAVAEEMAQYDEDNVDKYSGFYAYSKTPIESETGRAVLRVYDKYSCLVIKDAGLEIYRPLASDEYAETGEHTGLRDNAISAMLSGGNAGSVYVTSATGVTADNRFNTLNDLMVDLPQAKRGSVVVDSMYSTIINSSVLSVMHANRVQLGGTKLDVAFETNGTYNSLVAYPATVASKASGVNYYDKYVRKLLSYEGESLGTGWKSHTEVGTGFYYTTGSSYVPSDAADSSVASYHVINSSRIIAMPSGDTPAQYSVSQLILPGVVTSGTTEHGQGNMLPHPTFVTSLVSTNTPDTYTSNQTSMSQGQNYICEQLAYLSDIQNYWPDTSVTVPRNIGEPGYCLYPNDSRLTDMYYRTDPNPDVPGDGKFFIMDDYLFYLTNLHTTTKAPFAEDRVSIDSIPNFTRYMGKFIHLATPLPNAAGKVTTHYEYGVYLDGVMINPYMYMTLSKKDELDHVKYETTIGASYLAWGPTSITDMIAVRLYRNLTLTTPERTLHTSKFSNGLEREEVPSDMNAVWMTLSAAELDGDEDHARYMWDKVFSHFIVSYANNRLSIDFKIHSSAFKAVEYNDKTYEHYVLPVCKPDSTSPTVPVANELVFFDPDLDKNHDYTRCGNESGDYGKTMHFVLPIDHLLGNHLRSVVSLRTGDVAKMWGRVYFTGNENVYITGDLSYSNVKPGRIRACAVPPHNTSVRGAYLTIEIAGWNSDTLDGAVYDAHMEGMVNYVE